MAASCLLSQLLDVQWVLAVSRHICRRAPTVRQEAGELRTSCLSSQPHTQAPSLRVALMLLSWVSPGTEPLLQGLNAAILGTELPEHKLMCVLV